MSEQTTNQYHASTLRVLVYLQQHLDDAIDLESLAGIAGFSPFHFHRIFHGMVGESVMEHVRRLRLERASSRLTHSEESVTQIAFAAGYETLEAFSRAFRTIFDESPSEFRKRKRSLLYNEHSSGIHYTPDNETIVFKPHSHEGVTMEVKIETLPPMKVAFVRHIGPYQDQTPAWQRLVAWAGPKGLLNPNTMYLGMYYDDPEVTAPEKLRVDVCCTVDNNVAPDGEIGIQTIGSAKYVTAIRVGSVEKMGASETYAYLMGEWIPKNGVQLKQEPCLEIYLSDHTKTKPEDFQTKICIPIE